jgi:hypothetical protein
VSEPETQQAGDTASASSILDDVLADVGAAPAGGAVTLRGADPVFPTPPRVGELGAAAIAAAALQAARLLEQRTGQAQHVTVDVDAAAAAMRSWTYLADVTAPPRAPSGGQQFFLTEDDRWIFLHRRAARHAARQERVLGCGPADAEVAGAVRRWKGADLEEAIVAADACAALVRRPGEWAELAQAAAVAELPLLEVTKIGDSDPEPAGGPIGESNGDPRARYDGGFGHRARTRGVRGVVPPGDNRRYDGGFGHRARTRGVRGVVPPGDNRRYDGGFGHRARTRGVRGVVPPGDNRPLGGLRVLDVTHVLAGPTCARTLAEHGSEG